MTKRILTTFAIFTIITTIAVGAILYGRGYRISPSKNLNQLAGTGLVVLTSNPDGARVYVDGNLTTATDNTINLRPGEYAIKIEKDGYHSWEKRVNIKKEEVTDINSSLFPIAPKLESITTLGASNAVLDPSGTLIAFTVASSSAEKNGIYLLDMSGRSILPLGVSASQLVNNLTDTFSDATLAFSPDSKQLIATVSSGVTPRTYQFSLAGDRSPQNITAVLEQYQQEWNELALVKKQQQINSLPRKLRPFAEQNLTDMKISPEDNKIVYVASNSATLPPIIEPPLPGRNSTPEQRDLQVGNVYVYDLKEDKNYLVYDIKYKPQGTPTPQFHWHANSVNLFFVERQTNGSKSIETIEFDGTNRRSIYAGPFDGDIYPWPDGSSIVILTNLNIPGTPLNLYRIGLK